MGTKISFILSSGQRAGTGKDHKAVNVAAIIGKYFGEIIKPNEK